jgi:CRP-like cAMP-binding protein
VFSLKLEGYLPLLDVMRSHAFLQGLADHQLATLAFVATEVTFEEDELVLVERQRSRFLYLILQGSVAVELYMDCFTVCVQALGPGRAFGWSALLDGQETLFQVRAREQTSALRLDGVALAQICQMEPALGQEIFRRMLTLVAGRVKATEERFAEMCGVRV